MSLRPVLDARQHVARFYKSDDELVEQASAYVIDALTSGETAMVVATRPHLVALQAALAEAGIEFDRACADRRLITVDADEALKRLIVDDWPDGDAFARELGGLIPDLVEAGRPLRVFGEVVGLLWHAGHVGAAIELESLWADLLRRFAFGLYCAYPANTCAGTPATDSIREICACHAAVTGADLPPALGGADAARVFAWNLVAIAKSRRFVADTLIAWELGHVADDAVLIVSELATNAVMHARSTFSVLLSWEAETLCISVRDTSASVPSVRNPSPTMISGRGLRLVSSVASRWGTDVDDEGKLVWAELQT